MTEQQGTPEANDKNLLPQQYSPVFSKYHEMHTRYVLDNHDDFAKVCLSHFLETDKNKTTLLKEIKFPEDPNLKILDSVPAFRGQILVNVAKAKYRDKLELEGRSNEEIDEIIKKQAIKREHLSRMIWVDRKKAEDPDFFRKLYNKWQPEDVLKLLSLMEDESNYYNDHMRLNGTPNWRLIAEKFGDPNANKIMTYYIFLRKKVVEEEIGLYKELCEGHEFYFKDEEDYWSNLIDFDQFDKLLTDKEILNFVNNSGNSTLISQVAALKSTTAITESFRVHLKRSLDKRNIEYHPLHPTTAYLDTYINLNYPELVNRIVNQFEDGAEFMPFEDMVTDPKLYNLLGDYKRIREVSKYIARKIIEPQLVESGATIEDVDKFFDEKMKERWSISVSIKTKQNRSQRAGWATERDWTTDEMKTLFKLVEESIKIHKQPNWEEITEKLDKQETTLTKVKTKYANLKYLYQGNPDHDFYKNIWEGHQFYEANNLNWKDVLNLLDFSDFKKVKDNTKLASAELDRLLDLLAEHESLNPEQRQRFTVGPEGNRYKIKQELKVKIRQILDNEEF
jgi:hypothetical protein